MVGKVSWTEQDGDRAVKQPTKGASLANLYVLTMDCETQRFTIDGPLTQQSADNWIGEAQRASQAGRRIFSIAVADRDRRDIATLGTQLGYEEWPPKTIIALPVSQNEIRNGWIKRDQIRLNEALDSKRQPRNPSLRLLVTPSAEDHDPEKAA